MNALRLVSAIFNLLHGADRGKDDVSRGGKKPFPTNVPQGAPMVLRGTGGGRPSTVPHFAGRRRLAARWFNAATWNVRACKRACHRPAW